MPVSMNVKEFPVPKHQADAVISQANPVSGTKYTVLDTTKNVRIIGVYVNCTWTVQPTPLEVHITLDGVAWKFSFTNPVSATGYFIIDLDIGNNENGQTLRTNGTSRSAFILEGRSVKVEVEITGGTVSNLFARMKYAKW